MLRSLKAALACLGWTLFASAQASNSFEPIARAEEGVNLAGVMLGTVPEFWGSSDSAMGIAPMARLQLGGERYVQWLGAELTVNLLNHRHWRAGPSLGVRFGRREVNDPVVRAMQPVASTGEIGAFVAYTEPLGDDPRHRWGFNAAVTGATGSVYGGLHGLVSGYWMRPLTPWFTLNLGGGLGVSGSGFQRAYFGVTPTDAPLFVGVKPGGSRPDAGLTDVRALAGGMLHLSRNWLALVGVRLQRLIGGIADSPIVLQRGDTTRWVAGAGVVYLWR